MTSEESDRLFDVYCRQARKVYWAFVGVADAQLTGNRTDKGKETNPRWDGGEDQYGREHKPVWPKIVKTAIDAGLDVYTLIAAQFQAATIARRPQPTECHGDKALANVVRTEEMQVETMRGSLQSRQESFYQLVVTRAIMRKVGVSVSVIDALTHEALLDPKAEIDSVFRYCEAVRLGVDLFLDPAFRYQAIDRYMQRQKGYDANWGVFIPSVLRKAVDDIRASFRSRRAD